MGFELGERHFDRIEIGTIGRQEEEPCAALPEDGLGFGALVAGEVVEDRHLGEAYVADSTGRRNTVLVDLCQALVKRLGGCLPAQRLTRASIESRRHGGDGVGAVGTQIGTLWEVLAQ